MPVFKKWIIVLGVVILLAAVTSAVYLIFFAEQQKIFFEENELLNNSAVKILLVDDVEKTIEFYEKYFDFTEYKRFPFEGEPTLAVMEFKKIYVMFKDRKTFAEKKLLSPYPEISPSFELYIDVDEAYPLYLKLKTDLELVQDYERMFYNRFEFSVKDLNGYIITFSQDASIKK